MRSHVPASRRRATLRLGHKRRRRELPPTSTHPRKSVRAPAFAADAVMDEEEALGIVFVLDRAQPRVVLAPEGVLPVRLEKVGFPDIGADAGQELADFVHRSR